MISIIIPHCDPDGSMYETLDKCVESINVDAEIIIADDGSSIKPLIDGAKTVSLETNSGYSMAVNDGVNASTGDILIIANNDMEFVDPYWLEALLKPLREGFDIYTIRTTDADGWETEDRYEPDAKFGSILAMSRETFDKLGGFDPHFRGYFADLDMRRKALNDGLKIVKNHNGLVEHQGKKTYKKVDKEDKEFYDMRQRYMDKWGFIE